ncbi:integrator complex subunit 6-like [Erinaceus europaeus]|uniref:Integrator complex subunit 6-like n=1 Tax=Erinaceus europaeus TaxID=9365 RepID=A0ABM3WWB4_ERIEU|nr:integrator complex subunit 6-like [Erinaceus europaeus]
MIDEADEFVVGPQNKVKRPGEPNSPLLSKRRRNSSLLWRKPQASPPVTNHVGGKGPPSASWIPSYPNLVHTDTTVNHDVQGKMENGQIPSNIFVSKSASAELVNLAAESTPPNQLDFLSDDFVSLRRDGLIHKPGSNALASGTKNSNVSVEDRKVSAASTLGTMPNVLQITPAMAQGINADIKHQLMKEVRKFGRKYERIFILLEEVQGPLAVKKQFVEFTIKEAARFKRRVLIQYLEKIIEKIDSHHFLNNINYINSRSLC